MKELLRKHYLVFVALIVGVAAGRFTLPAETEVVTEYKYVDKIVEVEKKVYVKQEVKKEQTKKTKKTRKITKADGTVIEETIQSEEDLAYEGTKEEIGTERSKSRDKSTAKKSSDKTKYNTKRVRVSAMVGVNASTYPGLQTTLSVPNDYLMYGVHASYTVLGPFSVGAFGTTTKEFGISFGIEL